MSIMDRKPWTNKSISQWLGLAILNPLVTHLTTWHQPQGASLIALRVVAAGRSATVAVGTGAALQ